MNYNSVWNEEKESLHDYLKECKTKDKFPNFSKANLSDADVSDTDVSNADLSCADVSNADLDNANLSNANLSYADLSNANLSRADLSYANLSYADLTGADLSGANLSGANLTGIIRLGSKEQEQQFAKDLLGKLESGDYHLNMSSWHTCDTTHCIAGFHNNDTFPGAKASRALPTLAKYFFASNEKALEALRRVASGEESIFNDN